MSLKNGLVLKGDRVVILESRRGDIIERIHQAHQGVDKCHLRARPCVFWPNINDDIELHEVLTRPWQVVATDFL